MSQNNESHVAQVSFAQRAGRFASTAAAAVLLGALSGGLLKPLVGPLVADRVGFGAMFAVLWVGSVGGRDVSWFAALITAPLVGAFAFVVRWLLPF
jgi:hypothetical protein